MSTSPIDARNSSQPVQESSQDQQRQLFRQYLRQADKFILEQRFAEARDQLTAAKSLFPGNAFIAAFEERIEVFESKIGPDHRAVQHHTKEKSHPAGAVPTIPQLPLTRDTIEQQLREEIEMEYRMRYTQELRAAEERAANLLQEEKLKLKHQQDILRQQFDREGEETRKRLEADYAQKLPRELAAAEQRVEKQFREKLAAAEREMEARLTEQRNAAQQELAERMKREHEELQERERASFREREQMLKNQFQHQLLDALRKNETVLREQTSQQQNVEADRLKKELTVQFEAELAKEREEMQRHLSQTKSALEESSRQAQQRMQSEGSKQVQEQLEQIRKREEEKFEKQRADLRKELEEEYRKKFDRQAAEERESIQRDADVRIEQEKSRLQEEFSEILKMQNENLQKVRTDLRGEMEQEFLKRLERIDYEYDQKMELLGAAIPASPDERMAMYKTKMRLYYVTGQPSDEHVKILMRMKELLNLTFDDHLAIESDVRLELYSELVEKKIVTGELDFHRMNELDNLKQQFRITVEEAAKLEPYILSSFQRFSAKGKILVVDDDPMLLQSIDQMLSETGYQVVTASDIKNGMEKLATTPFDAILSDIKFQNGELDGFKFFKLIQEQPKFRKIPFLFMSSLQDGVIVQSGVQLGVDDYITKPMDPDLLIATIEGKLKRYRTLNRE